MKRKVLIINGHPNKDSFCTALAESYAEGAKYSGADVITSHLIDLDFDPILRPGLSREKGLEPDLLNIQKEIKNADHLVFAYPNWWGTYPALLKGFIDKVFLPDFAYKYQDGSSLPKGLLRGKSARLIVTMDTPYWYYSLIYKKPGHRSMKKSILDFCGIKPTKITTIGPVKGTSEGKRKAWIDKVNGLGKTMR